MADIVSTKMKRTISTLDGICFIHISRNNAQLIGELSVGRHIKPKGQVSS
jgi:hypothetical protein